MFVVVASVVDGVLVVTIAVIVVSAAVAVCDVVDAGVGCSGVVDVVSEHGDCIVVSLLCTSYFARLDPFQVWSHSPRCAVHIRTFSLRLLFIS